MTNPGRSRIDILTALIGLGVAILLAGVPWAYTMQGRLSKIEALMEETVRLNHNAAAQDKRITLLEATIRNLQVDRWYRHEHQNWASQLQQDNPELDVPEIPRP